MPKTVQISDSQHEALTQAAQANGTTIGRLLSIIIDVALFGIPAVIRKWHRIQQEKNQNE